MNADFVRSQRPRPRGLPSTELPVNQSGCSCGSWMGGIYVFTGPPSGSPTVSLPSSANALQGWSIMPNLNPEREPDPTGPFRAKGVGEPGCVNQAPAIANAIYDAVRVRIWELPMTPERMLKAPRGRR